MMTTAFQPFSLTPGLPAYRQARAFLKIMSGVPYTLYRRMYDQLWEQKGTPQETQDWSNPDEWIEQRLNGQEKNLAQRIWKESEEIINPRYTRGCWYLCSKHNLISHSSGDQLEITTEGEDFYEHVEGEQTAQIDQKEGLLNILQVVSEHSPGRRNEILPSYIDFCNTYTTYRSLSVHKSSLYDRLVNLNDRGLIRRSGLFYEVTDTGLKHLQEHSSMILGRVISTKQTRLQELFQDISQEARIRLADHLSNLDPYKFEQLVSLLLEEMGYSNITVTAPSNDKGVDVVADIELGISSVREVVQVKRQAGSINRTVLDQLRGSLHRFNAMRGTIITLGTFSSGAKSAALERGAAPITLIDGTKLLDLLMQYEIGISKKAIEFFEFDDSKLLQFAEEQEPFEERERE